MKKTIYSDKYARLTTRVKSARLESGLTQQQAASALAQSQSYISRIERGQLRIDVIQLQEIAKLYGKELKYFLG